MQRAILPSAQLRPSILELQLYLSKPWRCFTRPSQHHQSDAGFSYLGSPRSLFSTTSIARRTHQSRAPLPSASRGPVSKEDTQTDFSIMDVLSNTPAPSTSIDACVFDGFHLNSGVKVTGGAGVVLLGGEAFAWRPWEAGQKSNDTPKLLNAAKQWEVDDAAWGLLKLIWPKPDLLIIGLGPSMHPLSPRTKQYISSLGIRVDILDTRNAASQFNLLATERGTDNVAAALIPYGFIEGHGCRDVD